MAVCSGITLYGRQSAMAGTRVDAVKPALRFVTIPNYAFGIAGTHWGDPGRVTVTLYANRQVERVTVQTIRTGSFLIGITSADLCQTTTVQARDRTHRRQTLHGPAKVCLVILEGSPHMTVLRGKLLNPALRASSN